MKITWRLITVGVRLERTIDGDTDVFRLLLGKLGEFGTKSRKVEVSYLFIKVLGKHVNLALGVLVCVSFSVKFQLSKDLVRERA